MAFLINGRIRLFALAVLCLAVTLGSLQANAGNLGITGFALNDGFGPDAGQWHGTVTISAGPIPFFGDVISAEVDWAAFGPGGFQDYLDGEGIAQLDPSAPLEVIYVYQISSVSLATPGIDTLTVGLDTADGRGTVSAPAFVPTGAATEKSPASGGDNNTSMAWFFNGTELHVGDTSSLLVFTSPFAPELDYLSVQSGLAGSFPLVASPSDRLIDFNIPEPSSVLLGLFGCLGLFGTGRRVAR